MWSFWLTPMGSRTKFILGKNPLENQRWITQKQSKNMADVWTCKVEAILAPLNVGPYNSDL